MGVSFSWLGHSAFWLTIDGRRVLIDPFISGNPLAPVTADQLDAEVILLSHAHGDHVGDTIAIARRTGALVVCNFEMGSWFMNNGLPAEQVFQVNPGGTYDGDFLSAKWTVAFHSSSFPDGTYGGQPNGFVITAGGYHMYYSGDTSLFSDMQLIGEEGLDLAFLPIGDTFTMGINDSIRAVRFLRPRYVVPMHYNTWPLLAQNVSEWADRVNRETSAQPIVMDPGGHYDMD